MKSTYLRFISSIANNDSDQSSRSLSVNLSTKNKICDAVTDNNGLRSCFIKPHVFHVVVERLVKIIFKTKTNLRKI
jgi:hypothetical protein